MNRIDGTPRGDSLSRLPYYYDSNGNLPPWFSPSGEFFPERFDPEIPYVPKGKTVEFRSNPGRKLENPFDLQNLRFIDPQSIRDAIRVLEDNRHDGLPSVCVIATGGTIASKMDKDKLIPGLDLDFLFDYAGRQLNQKWNRAQLSFPTLIDSSQMTLDYDADIAITISSIWARLSDEAKRNFQGFVITHGTDTMAPSSTRIAMMLGPNIDFSVGIVGSQTSIENSFNEVPDNLK